jgi:hypothetical protein
MTHEQAEIAAVLLEHLIDALSQLYFELVRHYGLNEPAESFQDTNIPF